MKIPVLETLFNQIAGRQVYKFIKKRFYEHCEIFNNVYFEENL